MKKRFLVNDDAASLWDEFEENKSIEVVGGTSPVAVTSDSTPSDIFNDHTVTLWSKSF